MDDESEREGGRMRERREGREDERERVCERREGREDESV